MPTIAIGSLVRDDEGVLWRVIHIDAAGPVLKEACPKPPPKSAWYINPAPARRSLFWEETRYYLIETA